MKTQTTDTQPTNDKPSVRKIVRGTKMQEKPKPCIPVFNA